MRVVLDCNVLISAGLTDGACRQVLAEVIRRHDWCHRQPTGFSECRRREHPYSFPSRIPDYDREMQVQSVRTREGKSLTGYYLDMTYISLPPKLK